FCGSNSLTMSHFHKILLFLGLVILTSVSANAQTLTFDKANDNYSESFDVPVNIDSISFNRFQIKLSTSDPALIINQVILNKKFSKGTLQFASNGSTYTIDYSTETPITITKKEKIFDLKLNTNSRFSEEELIVLNESN